MVKYTTEEELTDMLDDKKGYLEYDEEYCNNCGSRLGIDCGDAEPDYNNNFCSVGCSKSHYQKNEDLRLRIEAEHTLITRIIKIIEYSNLQDLKTINSFLSENGFVTKEERMKYETANQENKKGR
jgi:hypothetical protein